MTYFEQMIKQQNPRLVLQTANNRVCEKVKHQVLHRV